jgi:phosphatidylglycerophosphatase A
MAKHPAHWIALGFGSGLSPKAPGTVGTLWAWASWWLFNEHLTQGEWAWLIVVSTLVGWWACKVTAENMGIADPGAIVWDEVVAFWLILWLLDPSSFLMQCFAFALFRYFDAAKPGPVTWADRLFKGFGWRGAFGILLDDFVAAFCTLLCFALWRAW